MTDDPGRAQRIGAALEAIMEPGDVALVLGRDDTRILLYGKDYREAYGKGVMSPQITIWSVVHGYKLLGELLEGHMHICIPQASGQVAMQAVTPELIDKFEQRPPTDLTPAETFPFVGIAYGQLAMVLDKHLGSCAPQQYAQLQQILENEPSQKLWKPGDPQGNPS